MSIFQKFKIITENTTNKQNQQPQALLPLSPIAVAINLKLLI
jgi:hypothetical protein